MKVIILLLMLNLLGVSSVMMNKNLKKKIEGNWQTVYLASSTVEKIKEGSPLRTYFRRIECGKKCKQIYLYFYVNCSLGTGDSTVLVEYLPSMYHRSQDSILSTQVWSYMANIPGLGEWRRGANCQQYEVIGKRKQEFYQAQYEGKTTFMVKMVNEKILLFHYFNKDRRGKVTRVAGILAFLNYTSTNHHAKSHASVVWDFHFLIKQELKYCLTTLTKAKQLTKDEMTQYMDFVEEIGIEDENVQRVLDTDTCPKKIRTR